MSIFSIIHAFYYSMKASTERFLYVVISLIRKKQLFSSHGKFDCTKTTKQAIKNCLSWCSDSLLNNSFFTSIQASIEKFLSTVTFALKKFDFNSSQGFCIIKIFPNSWFFWPILIFKHIFALDYPIHLFHRCQSHKPSIRREKFWRKIIISFLVEES